jgi:hypothetical protein
MIGTEPQTGLKIRHSGWSQHCVRYLLLHLYRTVKDIDRIHLREPEMKLTQNKIPTTGCGKLLVTVAAMDYYRQHIAKPVSN